MNWRTPATWVGAAPSSAARPWSVSTASTPRPSETQASRATSPAVSIRLTVWVTPGAGVAHRVGEHRHPQPVAVGLGEPDQDLVLRQGDPVLLAQVPVEAIHEQGRADQEGAPGALLVLVEPGHVRGVLRHGNKITKSVVED